MEFKSLKNIETSFRQIRLFGIVVVSLCALVAICSVVPLLLHILRQGEHKALAVVKHIDLLALLLGEIQRQHYRAYCDSIVCDFNDYPYDVKTYARQMIIRQSNVTERSLITRCRLVNSNRSDDNPNGFQIEGLTILENKDLITTKRSLSQ